jgi:hypothetical protein
MSSLHPTGVHRAKRGGQLNGSHLVPGSTLEEPGGKGVSHVPPPIDSRCVMGARRWLPQRTRPTWFLDPTRLDRFSDAGHHHLTAGSNRSIATSRSRYLLALPC